MIQGVQRQTMTFIVKLTEQCNLACTYCYIGYAERCQGEMHLSVLRRLFRQAFSTREPKVDFVFHGGEPLLVGAGKFREILALQSTERQHCNFSGQCWNGLQTNGTLIDAEWADLLKDAEIDVGVTIDYPRSHHDRVRADRQGSGTFDRAINGIRILQSAGVSKIGALTIVSARNVAHLSQMYSFFKTLGIGFRPNVYFPESPAKMDADCVRPEDLTQGLITLFDIWLNDQTPLHIDLFEDIIESMVRGRSRACTFLNQCNDFIGIRPNGDAFICDRFTTPEFRLGNIMIDDLAAFATCPASNRFSERSLHLDSCSECQWFPICRGGCPSYAYSFHGSIAVRDYYCTTRKELFGHIRNALRKEETHAEAVAQEYSD